MVDTGSYPSGLVGELVSDGGYRTGVWVLVMGSQMVRYDISLICRLERHAVGAYIDESNCRSISHYVDSKTPSQGHLSIHVL